MQAPAFAHPGGFALCTGAVRSALLHYTGDGDRCPPFLFKTALALKLPLVAVKCTPQRAPWSSGKKSHVQGLNPWPLKRK